MKHVTAAVTVHKIRDVVKTSTLGGGGDMGGGGGWGGGGGGRGVIMF